MADTLGIGSSPATSAGSALERQTDALLRGQKSAAAGSSAKYAADKTGVDAPGSSRSENLKIDKSAKDFESILLGSWLQDAEQSFAKVPGGDDEDADAGGDQLQSMSVQSLAGALTASGGVGLAKLISTQLHKADDRRSDQADSVPKVPNSSPLHHPG